MIKIKRENQVKHGFMAATALMTAVCSVPAGAQDISELTAQMAALQKQIAQLQKKVDASEKKAASSSNAPLKVKWEPAPKISSPDGNFEMNLRGRLLVDAEFESDKDGSENLKATEFRAARLGIEGKAGKNVKYKFEADFAGDLVRLKDAYIQWKGPIKLTFGQFKTPNSLEEQTSSRYITFMERAAFTDAFDLARQMGIGAGFGGENYTLNVGVFRGSNGTKNEDEGLTVAARATYSPKFGDAQMHFGASVRRRNQGDDQNDLRYRQRPFAHLASRFINTGRIANKDTMLGFEVASIFGPLAIQGEWATLTASLSNPAAGQSNPSFSGGYVEASYFLTGEKRAYSAKKGVFGRTKVKNANGSGALQLAVRFDTIDLSDDSFQGGQQDTFLIGASWWLNNYTRFMANYSNSKITDAFAVEENGLDGKNSVNTFGLRAQVDW